MGVSWYREFIALRNATLTERNAVETAGRVGLGTSSAPIRSVNAATLDETRELTSPRVSSSAAPASPPSPRSTP